ncbi:hypothetical protein DEU38_113164 [Rhodococcus sp. AG1013]|nr:hypothetical protein DEU38_113164 [Rhodococcus sp. AG1013]
MPSAAPEPVRGFGRGHPAHTGHNEYVKVEILYVDACPNSREAGERVLAALASVGRADVEIEYRVLATSAEAAASQFAGSPTILVDGVDPFPAERVADLACRVYRTESGLAGVPTVAQLAEVFRGR